MSKKFTMPITGAVGYDEVCMKNIMKQMGKILREHFHPKDVVEISFVYRGHHSGGEKENG